MGASRTLATIVAVVSAAVVSAPAMGQGGCGSVCLPLEVLDPERADVADRTWRLIVTTEYANFNTFRIGSKSAPNPGGAEADIHTTSFIVDYGLTDRVTLSLLVPYVRKIQRTNMFGRRVAEGLGDASLFGRYRLTRRESGVSLVGGLGLKGPTGTVDETDGSPARLPQPFQTGSGAWDLVPTLSYYQRLSEIAVFGGVFARLPLEENKFDYEFGNEYEAHAGLVLPVSARSEVLLSLDFLHADRDTDAPPPNQTAPPPFHVGNEVVNTGGNFLDVTPGFRIRCKSERTTIQGRFFIPLIEDWHGDFTKTNPAGQPAGQVAPGGLTLQLSLIHTFR